MTYIYDVECKTFIQDDEEICYIKVKYIMVYLVINQVVGGITLNTFLIRQSITNPFTYIFSSECFQCERKLWSVKEY